MGVYQVLLLFLGIFVILPFLIKKYTKSAKLAEGITKYFVHFLLILGSISMLAPFFWMLSTSFKNSVQAVKLPPKWIPSAIENFVYEEFGPVPQAVIIKGKKYKISLFNKVEKDKVSLFTNNYDYWRNFRDQKVLFGTALLFSSRGQIKKIIYPQGKKPYELGSNFLVVISQKIEITLKDKIKLFSLYTSEKLTHIFKFIVIVIIYSLILFGVTKLFNSIWEDIEKRISIAFWMTLLFGIIKYFTLFAIFIFMLNNLYHWAGPAKVDDLFSNYTIAWRKAMFGRYFFNSFIIAAITTVGQIICGALAAYAFSFMNFPFKNGIFLIFLGTMMVPQQVLLIPNFLILGKLHWIDRYPSLIVPWLASVFGIFLLRQFFLSIPRDLYDAAKIDGCSKFKFFTSILLPIAGAPITTIGIFTFLGSWNSFLWPLIVTNSKELRTIQVGLQAFSSAEGTKWGLLMAASTFSILPLVIGYFLAQKQFIQGIAKSGLKE